MEVHCTWNKSILVGLTLHLARKSGKQQVPEFGLIYSNGKLGHNIKPGIILLPHSHARSSLPTSRMFFKESQSASLLYFFAHKLCWLVPSLFNVIIWRTFAVTPDNLAVRETKIFGGKHLKQKRFSIRVFKMVGSCKMEEAAYPSCGKGSRRTSGCTAGQRNTRDGVCCHFASTLLVQEKEEQQLCETGETSTPY